LRCSRTENPDRRIVLTYAGAAHNHITRLFADGSIDPGFENTGTLGVVSGVPTIEVSRSAERLVAGRLGVLSSVGGTTRVDRAVL
jgi:hypothetical protein